MAAPSARTLQRFADDTRHQPGTLENVLRLLDLLQEIAGSDSVVPTRPQGWDARRQHVAAAQRASRHERTLSAPSEALNTLTVGAALVDLVPSRLGAEAGRGGHSG